MTSIINNLTPTLCLRIIPEALVSIPLNNAHSFEAIKCFQSFRVSKVQLTLDISLTEKSCSAGGRRLIRPLKVLLDNKQASNSPPSTKLTLDNLSSLCIAPVIAEKNTNFCFLLSVEGFLYSKRSPMISLTIREGLP